MHHRNALKHKINFFNTVCFSVYGYLGRAHVRTGFGLSQHLGQHGLQFFLAALQLQRLGAEGLLQADLGLLSLPQLGVQLLQLIPQGHHLSSTLCHLALALPQLLFQQGDLTCLLTNLESKQSE